MTENNKIENTDYEKYIKYVATLSKAKVLLINHNLGGGIETHLNDLSKSQAEKVHFIVLRPLDDKQVRLSLSLDSPYYDLAFSLNKNSPELLNLLSYLRIGHIHIHHTLAVNPQVLTIAERLNCNYDLTVHDYFYIAANPTLTNEEGKWQEDCLKPGLQNRQCLVRDFYLKTWQNENGLLLSKASRVIFPSLDLKQRFQQFYQLKGSVTAWHPDSEEGNFYHAKWHPVKTGENLRVLILGALTKEKGALLVEETSKYLEGSQVELHLLGYAFRPLQSSQCFKVHGPYSEHDLEERINVIQPHVVWYTSLWPETYSYTLSVALKMALPVVVPNIGAYKERVSGRPYSLVKDWQTPAAEWADFWQGYSEESFSNNCQIKNYKTESEAFYKDHYFRQEWLRNSSEETELINLSDFIYRIDKNLTLRERLLVWLWKAQSFYLFQLIVKLIPPRLKKVIVKQLSKRVTQVIKENAD